MLKRLKKILYRSISNDEISYEELNKMTKEKQVYLIDVRSSQEFEEGHLDGAINIPVYNIENEINKIVKNKSNIVILYCSSGTRSKRAKSILEKMGYTNVYNLKDGIDKIWVS